MAYALIWSETAYKTHKCQKCGHRVRYRNGDPCDDTLFDPTTKRLFCPACLQFVAKMKDTGRSIDELEEQAAATGGKYHDGEVF